MSHHLHNKLQKLDPIDRNHTPLTVHGHNLEIIRMSPHNLPPFPGLPTWGGDIHWFDNYKDIMSANEAADVVQRNWLDFGTKVDCVLLDLSDILQDVKVPGNDLVGLIQQLSTYQYKPTFFKCEEEDDEYTCGMKRRHNIELVGERRDWIERMYLLYQELCTLIKRYRTVDFPRRLRKNPAGLVNGIDFGKLVIGRPELGKYDLRIVFQEILQHEDEVLESNFDEKKQVTAFLKILFGAIEEANKMSNAEAEAVFDQMMQMDLKPGIAERTDALADQLSNWQADAEDPKIKRRDRLGGIE